MQSVLALATHVLASPRHATTKISTNKRKGSGAPRGASNQWRHHTDAAAHPAGCARLSALHRGSRLEDFDFNKGVTFLRGRFEHKTIEKFQIYQRGILCESKVDTDYCERFIEEILEFGREMGVNLLKVEGPDRTYFSSLEIQVNGSVDKNVAHLSWLSALLARKFKNYGISTGDYSTMGFKMSYDELGATTPKSTEFVFERRAGSPYSASLYASWGSLKTADHIEVLEALEKMMTD